MWQAPSQHVKNIAARRKRERERRMRPMHIRRVTTHLAIASADTKEVLAEVRMILNDLSTKGIGLYSTKPVKVGQEIVIDLEQPRPIQIRGRVVWCQDGKGDSRVLTDQSFAYRLGVQFIFENAMQEAKMKGYCEEFLKSYLYGHTNI